MYAVKLRVQINQQFIGASSACRPKCKQYSHASFLNLENLINSYACKSCKVFLLCYNCLTGTMNSSYVVWIYPENFISIGIWLFIIYVDPL